MKKQKQIPVYGCRVKVCSWFDSLGTSGRAISMFNRRNDTPFWTVDKEKANEFLIKSGYKEGEVYQIGWKDKSGWRGL
jgi:hypothetical protein